MLALNYLFLIEQKPNQHAKFIMLSNQNFILRKDYLVYKCRLNNLIYLSQLKTMKYLAAYALLSLSGKKDITAADIKNVLGSANTNVNDADLTRLVESLKGKDINKLIASGLSKVGSGSGPAPAAKGDSKPAVQEKKKQQPKKQAPKKKEEPKQEEEDMGLGGGLFD